jgi:hypothetical protein
MGKPPAPLYFFLHEIHIVPNYGTYLKYYTRYIDDAILRWDTFYSQFKSPFRQTQK